MGLLNDSPAAPVSHARARSLPFLAGFLAASAIAVFMFRLPAGRSLSWPALMGLALEQAFALSLVSAVTAAALAPSLLYKDRLAFAQLIRRASMGALWLAPLALFLRENSGLSVVVAAVLSVTVAKFLFESRPLTDTGEESLLTSLRADNLPLFPGFGLQVSVIAALSVQIGILAGLTDRSATGTLLIALAFTLWTWTHNRWKSASVPILKPFYSNPLSALTLVIVLMIVGLMPFLRHGSGHGHLVAAHHWFWHRPTAGGPRREQPTGALARPALAEISGGTGDRGIILWPEKQTVTKLVAPTPVMANAQTSRGNANPLVIPFDGVYWIFKSPDMQPPPDSRQAHISPDIVEIRSNDRRPLSIEAYDHLANLIDLDCCSRVQVAIRNADRYPESVSMELVLMNTTLPYKPSVSLGRMSVNSTPAWNLYEDKHPTINETLSFAVPSQRLLRAFDEVKIVFRLDQARADTGARIAIDHFVLVPRGL